MNKLDLTPGNIEKIFPHELEEVYLLIGIARKKYNPAIRSVDDNAKGSAVVRMVIRKKEDWARKITRMEAVVNNFRLEHIKPDDFNYYVSINPRDVNKAYKMLKERFAEWDYDNARAHVNRVDAEWVSCLQNKGCRSKKQYFMLDIDIKDPAALEKIDLTMPNEHIVGYVETRGGYHVLVKPFDIYSWQKGHQKIMKDYDIDIQRDRLIYLGRGRDQSGKYPLRININPEVFE